MSDRGQVIMLMPLFGFLFMVISVITIDVGLLLVERREAQAAVDLAALAAAQELPRSDLEAQLVEKLDAATVMAAQYLTQNGHDPNDPEIRATITTQYQNDVRKIELHVQRQHQWIFAGFFSIPPATVQARAVAQSNAIPRDVVVTLDRSGSMCLESHGQLMLTCPDPPGAPGEWQPFDQMRDAASYFSTLFEPSVEGLPFDYLSLVSYSSTASVDVGLTTDYGPGSELDDGIAAMVPAGRTNIGHAISRARDELTTSGHAGSVQVIVLLSDGVANRYWNGSSWTNCSGGTGCAQAHDYAIQMAQQAAAEGIALYTIGLTEAAGADLLREIADIGELQGGGGRFFDVADPAGLEETFLQIAELISFTLVE